MWARHTPDGWAESTPPDELADTDGHVWDLRSRDRALLAYHGWQPVDDSDPAPPDTDTGTWAPRLEMVRGRVTLVWQPCPWTPDELTAREAAKTVATIEECDRAAALGLLDRLTADLGAPADVWPTVKSWRALNAIRPAGVTDVAGLARIVLWMVPASLRTARAARKALRLALKVTTTDTADQETA